MELPRPVLPFLFNAVVILAVFLHLQSRSTICRASAQGLQLRYYDRTCPDAEKIVRTAMEELLLSDITAGAALLRLVFHDCQVKGCDGSILLEDDPARSIESELHSPRNFGIRRLEFIELVKQRLEQACPGVVSCADVVVLAARDVVFILGGPSIPVLTGRSDSVAAYRSEADWSLPSAASSVDEVLASFTNPDRGITTEEAIALLGSHTLGVSHCESFENRLKPTVDPSFQPQLALTLKLLCGGGAVKKQSTRRRRHALKPLFGHILDKVNMSRFPGAYFNDASSVIFDNQYFRDVMGGRGLLSADAGIATDARTAATVRIFAENRGAFMEAYTRAFIKLTNHVAQESYSNSTHSAAHRVRKRCGVLNES